jgi:anti-sigma factor RsiW
MSELSDEIIMAYADGELPAAERTRVERAIAADPALGARLAMFRATRETLHRAYAPVMTAPIPDRLLDAVYKSPMPAAPNGTVRAPRGARGESLADRVRSFLGVDGAAPVRVGLGYAAVLALGLGIGLWSATGLRRDGAAAPSVVAISPDGMVAEGALARALETSPSGSTTVADGAALQVTPVLSFRSRDRQYCRHYEIGTGGGASLAGLACRSTGGVWVVQMQTAVAGAGRTENVPGKYRPASRDAAPALEAAVGALMDGDALLAADEVRLLASGWK